MLCPSTRATCTTKVTINVAYTPADASVATHAPISRFTRLANRRLAGGESGCRGRSSGNSSNCVTARPPGRPCAAVYRSVSGAMPGDTASA
ncbi:hypothetical protein D3C83_44000 [compost metagenome]